MPKTKQSAKRLFENVNAQAERKLVDKLREIGLDQYVELPQITVMGDTSSGKSLLLSAISGVSFPSYQVLCNLFRQCRQMRSTNAAAFGWVSHSDEIGFGPRNERPPHCLRVTRFIKRAAADVFDRVVKAAAREMDTLLRAKSRPFTQDRICSPSWIKSVCEVFKAR